MKISLFQGILLGACVLAAGVGLFVFATYSNSGGANAVGSITIWGTLPSASVTPGLLAATKVDHSLKGVTYVEKSPDVLISDLTAAIATGAPPDLVLASQEELVSLAPFVEPIPLGNVSARTFTDTFADEGALFAAPQNAGWYGLPLLIDPMVLFYNSSILSSSGIASPPATWEALTGLVSAVAQYTPTKQITRGLIALGTYDNVHDARGILSMLFLQTGVPVTSRANTTGQISPDLGLASPSGSGEAPGPAVVRFYTQFADPSKVSYTWNESLPDSQSAFGTGDLALYLGYVSEARFLTQADPNLSFDVAPVPEPATAPTKATYGLVYALMIPHGAKNAQGAYKVEMLLVGDAEEQALAAASGLAPATRSALAAPSPSDPIAATAYTSALYAKGWLSPAPTDTDSVFSTMISAVITGGSLVEDALSTAERSISVLIQK